MTPQVTLLVVVHMWSVRVAHPQLGFESFPAVDLLLLLSTVSITI